ncbi:MAG: hypothetical protein WC373_14900 [Smithella sp.]
MKAINKKAAEFFQAAINRIPEGETSCKIDNGGAGIMALHIERIGANKYGELYSFAHYFEQNGDMMRDPDIVMLRSINPDALTGKHAFFPISFRQDGGFAIDREYVVFNEDGNGWKIAKKQQADLAVFCGQWARNIADQQGVAKIENGVMIFKSKAA